jgi:hypothetical protein
MPVSVTEKADSGLIGRMRSSLRIRLFFLGTSLNRWYLLDFQAMFSSR